MRNAAQDNRKTLCRNQGQYSSLIQFEAKDALLFIIFFAFAVLFFTYVVTLNIVPSESMEPTIHKNHIIFSWRLDYLIRNPVPDYGEVIVFRENTEENRLLVKRVIGLPGDVISFNDGIVYRNGIQLKESYLLRPSVSYSLVPEFTVPDDALFVLGDNRENSRDSRFMEGTYVAVDRIYAREIFQIPFL